VSSDKIDTTMSKRVVVLVVLAVLVIFLLRQAGSFLVVNAPEHADLIVVLGGGNNDIRYWNGVRLMNEGWSPRLMLNVFDKAQTFGNRNIDLARNFVQRTAPGRSKVCPIAENSTYDEARYLEACLRGTGVKSILLVTSEYHTRRSLSILQARLPQYRISIYAAADPYQFGQHWWRTREWAKTTLEEWERYLWWQCVDSWRSGTVVN
jgi:uncharacterized SAM-binding protein YcdF (DUF218 family)